MEFTLTITEEEVSVIGSALAELPFKVASSLISKLQGQINAQLPPQAPVETVPDAE